MVGYPFPNIIPQRSPSAAQHGRHQPAQPSPLRRAASLSVSTPAGLPRSQRVPSLADLVRRREEGDNKNTQSQEVTDSSMSSNRRAVDSGNAAEEHAAPEGIGGLGIRMGQRLQRVDEWLDKEEDPGNTGHSSTPGRESQTRGPRELVSKVQQYSGNDQAANANASASAQLPPVIASLRPGPLAMAGILVDLIPAPIALSGNRQIIPGDGERVFSAFEIPAEDAGKSASALADELMESLLQGQTDSMLALSKSTTIKIKKKKTKKKKKGKKEEDVDSNGEIEGDVVDVGSTNAKKCNPTTANSTGNAKGSAASCQSDTDTPLQTPTSSTIRGTVAVSPLPSSAFPSPFPSPSLPLPSSSSTSPAPSPPLRLADFSPAPPNSALGRGSGIAPLTLRPDHHRLTSLRPGPLRPAPLRITRKPVESSPEKNQEISATNSDFEPTNFKPFSVVPPKLDPAPAIPPPLAYGQRVYSNSGSVDPLLVRVQHERPSNVPRPALYFFDDERESILQAVNAKTDFCEAHGEDCIACRERWFAYFEIKAMPTSSPPEERAKIMALNRSLRNIKTELENLSENGMISDECYDLIIQNLPAESSLNASSRPAPSSAPVSSMKNTSIGGPPPAYTTPDAPSLPARQSTNPSKPALGYFIALYPYSVADDSNDCTFVVNDEIILHEKVNPDWWMGRNVRTGKEGVFPSNYITPKASGGMQNNGAPQPLYGNEKAQPYGYQGYQGYQGQPQQQQQQQQYNNHHGPSQPGPSNPYNSDVPPEAVANEPGKGAQMGKKFGKKLGNAAIFGAGASIGGKIVNGIF